MQRTTSALFLDFDNIFGGLLDLDREAALALAERPGDLVHRLGIHGLADGHHRDLLVRRAYLNPNGSVHDEALGNDRGRLFLGRFRPHLVRAGFEVIDCPALTTRQKNAADIRIVIDVLAALGSPVRYDEVIIASSDADFTPLLLKLRAEDRRTTIITAGILAPAYQAVADRYINEQQLIGLLLPASGVPDDEPSDESLTVDVPGVGDQPDIVTGDPGLSPEEAADRARVALVQLVADASRPVNLAAAGAAIHRAAGSEVIRETGWFGGKTFTGFVQAIDPTLRFSSHFLWDPSRHDEPAETAPDPTAVPAPVQVASGPEMPAIISELCAVTDMPRLASGSWAAAFDALADYADSNTFALNRATAWSRDVLAERGFAVGRQPLSFIIRGCLIGSVRLDADPPPTATELREGFARSVAERATSAGVELDEQDLRVLDQWLSGAGELTTAT